MGISSMPAPRDSLVAYLLYSTAVSIAALAFLDLQDPGDDVAAGDRHRRGEVQEPLRRDGVRGVGLPRVPGAVRAGVGGQPAPLRPPLPQRLPGDVAPLRPGHLPALPRPPPPTSRRRTFSAGTFAHGGLLGRGRENWRSGRPAVCCCNILCGLPCERSSLRSL
jgi:hypothetical protein